MWTNRVGRASMYRIPVSVEVEFELPLQLQNHTASISYYIDHKLTISPSMLITIINIATSSTCLPFPVSSTPVSSLSGSSSFSLCNKKEAFLYGKGMTAHVSPKFFAYNQLLMCVLKIRRAKAYIRPSSGWSGKANWTQSLELRWMI